MRKVYRTKINWNDEVRDETVIAESIDEARDALVENNLEVIEISLAVNETFSLLTSTGLNGREMSQFYFTLGRRVRSGMDLTRSVREAAEFTRDIAVKTTLNNMASSVERGQEIDEAMREAGLPQRDWSLVRALSDSGRLDSAFEGLGRDYARRSRLDTRLKGLVYQPVIFLSLVYALAAFSIIYVAPRIEGFFNKLTTIKIPHFAALIYHFADAVNAHIFISGAVYIGAAVAAIFFVRSQAFRNLLDYIPVFRAVSERSDHAALWSVFAMLYDSATDRDRAAIMTGSIAKRPENEDSFNQVANNIQSGRDLSQAVAEAGFPDWVRLTVTNALNSGGASDIVESLQMFTDNLAADVEMLSERLSAFVQLGSMLIMGLAVLGVAMISVIPLLMSALSAA